MGGEQKVPGGRPSRAELQCVQESMGRCWVSLWRVRALRLRIFGVVFWDDRGSLRDSVLVSFLAD